MTSPARIIGSRQCGTCGRWVNVVASGRMRAHRTGVLRCDGSGEQVMDPDPAPVSAPAPAPAPPWIEIRIDFGARAFICSVPLGLESAQVSDVRRALRTISATMDSAYGAET